MANDFDPKWVFPNRKTKTKINSRNNNVLESLTTSVNGTRLELKLIVYDAIDVEVNNLVNNNWLY